MGKDDDKTTMEQWNSHKWAESLLRVVSLIVNVRPRECGCMREKYKLWQKVVCSVASSPMG